MPDAYNPWGAPVFPTAADNAMQPETFVPQGVQDWTQQAAPKDYNILSQIAGSLGKALMYPGQVAQSKEPISTEDMVGPAFNLAGMLTLGAGAAPQEANALNMGIKAYHGSPHDFEALTPGTTGNYGPAVYHHLDAADAERYRPEGGKVYENNLNIQRPFQMDKPVSAPDASAILRAMGNDKLADQVAESGRGYFSGNELWYWGMGQGGDQATKAAAIRKAGFDSIIGDPGREITGKSTRSPEIAVFDPQMIDIMRKYAVPGMLGAPILANALSEQKT